MIQALATPRQEARETRRHDNNPYLREGMEYDHCPVQRAAFLPD